MRTTPRESARFGAARLPPAAKPTFPADAPNGRAARAWTVPSGAFWRLILYEGTRTELDSDGAVFSRRPRAPIPVDRNPGVSVCVVNSDENIRTRAKTTGAAGVAGRRPAPRQGGRGAEPPFCPLPSGSPVFQRARA